MGSACVPYDFSISASSTKRCRGTSRKALSTDGSWTPLSASRFTIFCRRRRKSIRSVSRLEVHTRLAQFVQERVVGQVQVQWRQRDESLANRREVALGILVPARR